MLFNMKSLFSTGNAGTGTPDNRKSALQWLVTLPDNDVAAAQEEIVSTLKQLVEIKEKNQKAASNRLEVIDALDHHVQPLQATLCAQYLQSPRMSQAIEHRLWNAIYAYYITITHVYLTCLETLTGNPAWHAPESLILRLCVRSLYNLGHAFKWRFLRYDVPDAQMWDMLHALYRIAESGKIENQPTSPYASQEYRCGSLLLRTELLALAHPGSLQAEQIELLDAWLLNATESMSLGPSVIASRHHYFTDLTEPHGALPVTQQAYSSNCRGWDMSTLLVQLQRDRAGLVNPAPGSQINPVHRKKMLSMLAYAEKQWHPSQMGKLRKETRIKSRHTLQVVHGLSDLYTTVNKTQMDFGKSLQSNQKIGYDEMVDLQIYGFVTNTSRNRQKQVTDAIQPPGAAVEQWETENTSVNGYLTYYPAHNNRGLHLDSLLGIREQSTSEWKACVVRRLIKTHQATSLAGLEILAHHLIAVSLLRIQPEVQVCLTPDQTSVFDNDNRHNLALLTSPIEDGHFTIILDSVQYAKARLYKFHLPLEQTYIWFRLGESLEKGDLWIHAEALVIQENSAVPTDA